MGAKIQFTHTSQNSKNLTFYFNPKITKHEQIFTKPKSKKCLSGVLEKTLLIFV
jgi:hypothetical protein